MNPSDATVFGLRFETLVSGAAILAFVGAADAFFRWYVRRQTKRHQATEATVPFEHKLSTWISRELAAAVAPLTTVAWIVGGSIVARMLLLEVAVGPVGRPAAAAVAIVRDLGVVVALFWLAHRLGRVMEQTLASFASQTTNVWDDALLPIAGTAVRLLLPILALIAGVQVVSVPESLRDGLRPALTVGFIGSVSFLLYRCIETAETLVLQRYQLDAKDNLEARAVFTQVTVLKKIAVAVLAIFTVAAMLMVFESVRQLGTSILASAGVVSVIIGFAAQRSIATLLAGLQIAITQPIRLDDVVIVEGEWGRIEEISLTYVTVCIWDQRRLIVPITQFIERPFQNWTRTSAELLGTVFLYVDYKTPIDALRRALTDILEASPHWDGRVNSLLVTGAREQTLEVRALASAANASLAWDLRCEVREKLVAFLQQHNPESLPRVRAEIVERYSASVEIGRLTRNSV